MRVYNRGKNPKKPNWWLTYYVDRKRVREPGKGTQQESTLYAREITRQLKSGTWVHPRQRPYGRDSFANFAREVIERRISRGVATADKDERGHVENHLIPEFGPMALRDLTHKRLKDAFGRITRKGLGGRTIRNIHSTLFAVLTEAASDELIPFAPAPLSTRRDELPPPVDKDPEWRDGAYYSLDELRKLMDCAVIPIARRIFYLTAFVTGARAFSEIATLKVRNYTTLYPPLDTLAVAAAKVGRHAGRRKRYIPVHPELKAWLDWWLGGEYQRVHGYNPTPERYLFPTLSDRRRSQGLEVMSQQELWAHWKRHDLPKAGLRHRRIHDLRRTLTTALRAAGVQGDQVAAVTHRSTGHRMQDQYTSWQWETLCQETLRVTWDVLTPVGHTVRTTEDGSSRSPQISGVQPNQPEQRK